MRAHTLILGGGVMGTSIAAHLAAQADPLAEPTVLVERRRLGAGSSGRSGAVLRAFYSSRELIGMARDSLRAYSGFATAHGRSIGFTRCGVLTIARPNAHAELVERNVVLMRECGVDVQRVDATAMRALVAGIEVADDAIGAWEPAGGFVDPQDTIEAFAALARSRGATLRQDDEAREFVVERGRVVEVRTSRQRYEIGRLVIAAGPWTHGLLARLGVAAPLRVVRPEQHFLEMPSSRISRRPTAAQQPPESLLDARFSLPDEPTPAHPVLLDLERGYYTRCEPRLKRSRVGALDYERDHVLDQPDALDETVSEPFQRWARERLEGRLPIYREQSDVGAEAAWYTLTPDAQPLIGPCAGLDNVFVVSGFSGHGFKLAPSIGEGVAQMLAGGPVGAFDADYFSPARFAGAANVWGGRFGL